MSSAGEATYTNGNGREAGDEWLSFYLEVTTRRDDEMSESVLTAVKLDKTDESESVRMVC